MLTNSLTTSSAKNALHRTSVSPRRRTALTYDLANLNGCGFTNATLQAKFSIDSIQERIEVAILRISQLIKILTKKLFLETLRQHCGFKSFSILNVPSS
jgi:hypothetical protein